MKNGTPYRIQLCLEPEKEHTQAFLKDQIVNAMEAMSGQSRWQRFASPVDKLSDSQLDYLTDLDGKERVAWCASVMTKKGERGIGLARYVKLPGTDGVAEFAITVVDEFQGQGVGYQLLRRLIGTASENNLKILRGYIRVGNRAMLALCRRFAAHITSEDAGTVRADIPI